MDPESAVVTVGRAGDLLSDTVVLGDLVGPLAGLTGPVMAQSSAHGTPRPVLVEGAADPGTIRLRWSDGPRRRVAPGQSIVLYAGDTVIGGGIVER